MPLHQSKRANSKTLTVRDESAIQCARIAEMTPNHAMQSQKPGLARRVLRLVAGVNRNIS